jgi:Zn-dependent protease
MHALIINLAVVLVSTTLRELGHVVVAQQCGVAAYMAVNWPLACIVEALRFWDIGVPTMVYNYGKTTYDEAYFRLSRLTRMCVILVGPFVHLTLAACMYYVLLHIQLSETAQTFAVIMMHHNYYMFVFNMMPLPTHDGFALLEYCCPDVANAANEIPNKEHLVPLFATIMFPYAMKSVASAIALVQGTPI